MADVPILARQQVAPGVQPTVNVPRRGAAGVEEQVLGQVAVGIGLDARDRADRAALLAAYTEAQQVETRALYGTIEDGKIVKPGLLEMRGLPLMEAHEQYEKDLRDQFDQIVSKQNSRVQGPLRQRLDGLFASSQARTTPHLSREIEAFQERTYNEAILSEIQSGAFAGAAVRVSPETGKIDTSQTEAAKVNLLAYVEGLAVDHPYLLGDQTQEDWIGSEYERVTSLLHDQTVRLALNNGDVDGAKRYLDEYGAEITPSVRDVLDRDVGKAFASYEAEGVAREAVAAYPLLVHPSDEGDGYATNAQGKALAMADAEAEGGPEAKALAKKRWEDNEALQKQHYGELLSQVESEVLTYGYEEAERRNPGLFGDYFKAGDLKSLRGIGNDVNEAVAQAELQRLARESLEDPVGYLEKDRSAKLAIQAKLGKHYEAWESKYEQDQKAGSVAPEVRSLLAGLADGAELDETREARLGLMATQIKADFEQGGTPMTLDKQRQVAENLVLEEVYIHGLSVNTEDPIFEATPDQLYDDLALFPELEDRMRAELVAAGVQNPTQDDAARLLLSKLALYGTQTPDGAGGLGALAVRDGGRADAQIEDEVLGGLSSEQFAQRLSGAAGAAAERTALTEAEIKRETAFLRARDPDDLARVARRAVGVGLTGDTRPAKLAKRIQDGTATEEDVRALLKASSELDFEDAEQRAADRRSLLPTVADDLIAEDPSMAAVLERIREASITSKAYKLGDPYQELFRVPKEDLTPAQLRRVEALIVRYSQP